MIAKIESSDRKTFGVYKANGTKVRGYRCDYPIANLYVDGEYVNVTTENGWCIIYDLRGCIVRKFR